MPTEVCGIVLRSRQGMRRDDDMSLGAYEGLVRATAARYEAYLDDDLDDIAQRLRVKVWQALRAYNSKRSSLPVKAYVFGCVRNMVKDILKEQSRRNKKRGGIQLHIIDVAGEQVQAFEMTYLSITHDVVFFEIEDEFQLPSTLTERERDVVLLLFEDYTKVEIARRLALSAKQVRDIHRSVQEKMADWRPSAADNEEISSPRPPRPRQRGQAFTAKPSHHS